MTLPSYRTYLTFPGAVRYNRLTNFTQIYYHGSTLIRKTTFWNLLRVS